MGKLVSVRFTLKLFLLSVERKYCCCLKRSDFTVAPKQEKNMRDLAMARVGEYQMRNDQPCLHSVETFETP